MTLLTLLVATSMQSGQATVARTPASQNANGAEVRSAVGGILVSPLIQRLATSAGREAEVRFTLENPGTRSETAVAEILPFSLEDWTYRTVYGASHPRDCATWFPVPRQDVELTAGQRKELRLPIRIPRGTEGPYWCMLKFAPRPTGSTTKSLVVYEIPIVMIVGKNPKPIITVGSPLLRRPSASRGTGAFAAVLPLTNDSDGFSVLGASGSLRNQRTGRIVSEFRVDDRNLMPRTKRELAFYTPPLADGDYRLEFRTILGSRALPLVRSDVSVKKGVAQLITEKTALQTAPVTLEPTSLNLAIPGGGQRSAVVRVTNTSSKNINIAIRPAPVIQGTDGSIGIGEGPLSGGVSIDGPGVRELKPGQTESVKLRIEVPRNAEGDLWFALAVQDAQAGKSLAEALYGTVSVPRTGRPGLQLVDPVPVKDRGRTIAIKYRVRNTGNVALRPDPNATVLADGVRMVERLGVPKVGDGGILPGKVTENSVMLPPSLKPGQYVVELAYQYGERDFARLRIPVEVAARKSK